MHLRRALLLLALVLGLAALVASLAPPRPERQSRSEPPATTGGGRQRAEPSQRVVNLVRVDFGHGERARPRPVELPAHVIVTVDVRQAGQVELRGTDQVDDAEPGTPASFDVFLTEPGRYEVVFVPVEGPSRRLGTLVGREPPGP